MYSNNFIYWALIISILVMFLTNNFAITLLHTGIKKIDNDKKSSIHFTGFFVFLLLGAFLSLFKYSQIIFLISYILGMSVYVIKTANVFSKNKEIVQKHSNIFLQIFIDKNNKELISFNGDYFIISKGTIFPLKSTKIVIKHAKDTNLTQIECFNYSKDSNIFYLINKKNKIIHSSKSKYTYSDDVWKEQTEEKVIRDKNEVVCNKYIIPNAIHMTKDMYFFVVEDEEYNFDNIDKLPQEYQEATIIQAKNKIPLGSTGVIKNNDNEGITTVLHNKKKFKDITGREFYEYEFDKDYFISIKNNKCGVIKKTKNKEIIIVDYGIYDYILNISNTFLLVKKKNDKHLNDDLGSHWPKIPGYLESIIDKNGNNVLDNAYYRKIEILDEQMVRLYSGSNLKKYKDYNLYTKEYSNYTDDNPKFPKLSNEKDYEFVYSNETKFEENIVIAEIIDGYMNEGAVLVDINKGKQLSEIFDFVEYFKDNICIVAKDGQYCFLDSYGKFYYEYKDRESNYSIIIDENNWNISLNEEFIIDKSINTIDCIYPLNKASKTFVVKEGENYGLIDYYGKKIIPCIYSQINNSYEKFLIAYNEDEYSSTIYNTKGEVFYKANTFIDDIITTDKIIILDTDKVLYQIDGNTVESGNTPPPTIGKYSTNDKRICSLIGIFNKNSMELIKYYMAVKTFSNGLLPVKDKNSKWGYIDENGTEVIPCIYDNVYEFISNKAVVETKTHSIIINKENKIIYKTCR